MARKINRRQALAAFGAVSLGGLLAACGDEGDGKSEVTTREGATASVQSRTKTSAATAELFDESATCALSPEQTEGPYYFDVDSIRSDIREDREGTLLRLAIRVRDAKSCEPIENAVVDVWHCDALGLYSGFDQGGGGGPGGGDRSGDETYLRGAQVTNTDGIVEFKTVYPGWYMGRTVHIHAKVHLDRNTLLTTQLYFDELVTEQVYARKPYSQHAGRDIFNDGDGIFSEELVLTLSKERDGYLGVMTFDVQAA